MHMLARLKGYVEGRSGCRVVTLFTSLLSLLTVAGSVQRCTVNEDCPTGGFCFKDECSRCLCPEGYRAIQLVTESRLTEICQKRPEDNSSRVFDTCRTGRNQQGSRRCPLDSHCEGTTCLCNRGLRPHDDRSRCRLGVFNEPCSRRQECDRSLGLQCKGRPGRCKCQASHHRPSRWTRFVLTRWDYSRVVGEPQECVARAVVEPCQSDAECGAMQGSGAVCEQYNFRAVGEPCQSDAECGAVQGSGAVCGLCGFCECQVAGHVPDVLGTTCGPGMGMGQTCHINSRFVCDGTRGLQCGDVCDIYAFDFRPKICRCSQMHDRLGGVCVAKQVGSPCYTDLDCYPVRGGFGHCEGGRCRSDASASSPDYQPYLASRDCRIKRPMSTMPPGGGHRKHTKHERHKNATHAHHQQELPVHAGKYHDDDGKSLVVNFDNITDILSLEVTTPRHNTERFNSVRQVSSSASVISQSPSLLHMTTAVTIAWLSLVGPLLRCAGR